MGIEDKFGIEKATEIDANCWKAMGKIEARELKEIMSINKNGVSGLMHTLWNTSWALYQIQKESQAIAKRGIFKVTKCRIQKTRVEKDWANFHANKCGSVISRASQKSSTQT